MSVTPSHFFTVDVEEYFQARALQSAVARDSWQTIAPRADRNVDELLAMLARHSATGTFFTLGWIGEHRPAIVRSIAAAGHEIASHGHLHERVSEQSPASFAQDVRKSKRILEDITGKEVLGYRAPNFSITPGHEWAFDVLIEQGYRYDSSIFPIRRRGYGYPGALRIPHIVNRSRGSLIEFPLLTTDIFGVQVPAAGGAYLRQFPLQVIANAFARAERRGESATFYIHPWEIDPDQPRLPVSLVTRLRHYRGLGSALDKIDVLLSAHRFTSIASALPTLEHPDGYVQPASVA